MQCTGVLLPSATVDKPVALFAMTSSDLAFLIYLIGSVRTISGVELHPDLQSLYDQFEQGKSLIVSFQK
jgi:hypothetical protein